MKYILTVLLCLYLADFTLFGQADRGKKLFRAKCLICHGVSRDLTGPALAGARERVGNDSLLYAWIRNNKKVLASGNSYFNNLYQKWNKAPMNVFEELNDEDIRDILAYIDNKAKEEQVLVSGNSGNSDGGTTKLLIVVVGALVFLGILWWFLLLQRKHKAMLEERENSAR